MNSLGVIDSYQRKEIAKGYVPENYIIPRPRETILDQVLDELLELPQITRFAPLWVVRRGNELFKALYPIKVRVYREDDFYFAENEALTVYGVGGSLLEAIEDLQSHIIHFWGYYRKLDPNQVTGDAVRLKAIYENLLIEEE